MDPGPLSVRTARTCFQRARGLAFDQTHTPLEALRIPRCRSVHTFGMRFPLDLIWLDDRDAVLRIDHDVVPRRVRSCRRATAVIETHAGMAPRFAQVLSRAVNDPLFRLVCTARALDDAPEDWLSTLLQDGELGLLPDDGGLDAVTAIAHRHDLVTIPILRSERTSEEQEATVIAYAASRPVVWIAPAFSDQAQKWAHDRGPMTLLIDAPGPIPDDERRRIERFVAVLGRQAE